MATGPVIPRPAQCQQCGETYIRTARAQATCSPICQGTRCYNDKVVRKSADECWGWSGFKYKGYGRMRYGAVSVGAHRFSYMLHTGPIPDGLTVLHSCDNPECTNPAHLSLGTNTDNNRDRDLKGRAASGERAGRVTLTEAEVRDMRAVYAAGGISMRKVAQRFGRPEPTVMGVLTGRTWRHVA